MLARKRSNDHPSPFAQCLDALYGAVQIGVAFPVHEKRIGPRFDKLLQEKVWVRNHYMGLQVQARHPPQRSDDRRPHRDVGHEVSIHHVHVDTVSPGLLSLSHLFTPDGQSLPQ